MEYHIVPYLHAWQALSRGGGHVYVLVSSSLKKSHSELSCKVNLADIRLDF